MSAFQYPPDVAIGCQAMTDNNDGADATRNAIIEECARVAASYRPLANAETIAAAIRALKGKE